MDFRVILTALGTVYFYEVGEGGRGGGIFFSGVHAKKWLSRGSVPTKKGKRGRGGLVKYCSKSWKWHNVKNCYRTNIEGRIQVHYKLSFSLKITFGDKNIGSH